MSHLHCSPSSSSTSTQSQLYSLPSIDAVAGSLEHATLPNTSALLIFEKQHINTVTALFAAID
jgi:hypothetical protein